MFNEEDGLIESPKESESSVKTPSELDDPKIQMRIIYSIMFSIIMQWSIVLMVVSFLPPYAQKHYPALNNSYIGVIIR